MSLFYSLTKFFFKTLFRTFHHHRIYGLKNLPKGAAIIAPNHTSLYDPPIVGASMDEEAYYLADNWLFKKPLLGCTIKMLNAYPLARSAKDKTSIKTIYKVLEKGKKVVIFPEGERSFDGKLLKLKPGIAQIAINANVPIVPAYIHGAFEVWPRDKKFPKFSGDISITFGRPIYPEHFSHPEKQEEKQAMVASVLHELEHLKDQAENS
jgi:1-acyl-sn-glycerol-3-phosphate acyltransferase